MWSVLPRGIMMMTTPPFALEQYRRQVAPFQRFQLEAEGSTQTGSARCIGAKEFGKGVEPAFPGEHGATPLAQPGTGGEKHQDGAPWDRVPGEKKGTGTRLPRLGQFAGKAS